MADYKLTRHGAVIRLADGASWLPDDANQDHRQYLADVARGAVVAQPDHEPEPEPSRDERLLAAVDSAKTAVAESKVFTLAQAAVLSAVFDGLGKAITGEAQ